MTYTYACPAHGDFDRVHPISNIPRSLPCPECGVDSPKVLRVSPGQFHFPAHFRTTLPTTGLKTGAGQSGGFENMKAEFNRWDSGARGIEDGAAARRKKLKREARDRAETGG